MKIGFIGIGRMGTPMAGRLMAAGHALAIYDVNQAACAPLVAGGARLCPAPDEAARDAAAILISVPGPKQVEAVMTGPHGVLAVAGAGTLVIDTSTSDPALSRSLAARCAASGVMFLDAPVSGGVKGATAGDLTAMVGGEAAAYDRALPLLRCLASRIHHLGPAGSGNVAKLVNQVVYLCYVAAMCEAAGMARRAGLEMPRLLEVLRTALAGQPLMLGWERQLETSGLTPGFPVDDALKDLDLAEKECREWNWDAPVFAAALSAYRDLAHRGHGDKDMTALFTLRR